MNNKLYVGQLPFAVDSSQLEAHFATVGDVTSARVITDRDSGRSKGFGFVEMGNESQAQAAIDALNGKDFGGRTINVSIAKPQEDRPRGGGFGGNGGGFRRGY